MLTIGQKLSHYRLLEQSIRDDIGETYLANDTDQRRQVFLKILPMQIRRNPGRLARIREDVEAAAQVSHPHLARTFTFEQGVTEDGLSLQFISTEYVRGRKLSELIPANGFELSHVLPWLGPLTEALAEAHRHNVIHRDLRPSNIVITPEGEPIITGLGLARIVRPDLDLSSGRNPSRSIEVIKALIQQGSLLDAIAYMAPEQAEGKVPSASSDLFSLGAIMYEMLTGERPFQGESYVELVSCIMRDEIDLITARRPDIPYIMGRTVAMCLQKDPKLRYQSMDQVRQSIDDIRKEVQPRLVIEEKLTAGTGTRGVGRTMPSRRFARIAIPVLCLIAGALGAWSLLSHRNTNELSGELQVKKLPISIQLSTGGAPGSAAAAARPLLSPDGRNIVYSYEGRLWRHDLTEGRPIALPGTEGAVDAFWAPDNLSIGFFVFDKSANTWSLRRIDLSATAIRTVCPLNRGSQPMGATWKPSGTIVYSAAGDDASPGILFMVSATGGSPEILLQPEESAGDKGYSYPSAMPQGDGLVMASNASIANGKLVYYDGKTARELISHPGERVIHAVYTAEGYILYQRETSAYPSLWALPVSKSMHPGTPFPVAERADSPSIASDGTLLYQTSNLSGSDQLAWVDRNGKTLGKIGQPQERIDDPVLSPDEKRVAVTGTEAGNTDIWIHELASTGRTRVTSDPAYDFFPVWSPSGNQIAFSSVRFSSADIFLTSASGKREPLPLITGARSEWITSWAAKGAALAYEVQESNTEHDIWYMPMKGNRKPQAFLQTPSKELYPQLNADATYLAYESDESGQFEIYLRRFPSGTGKMRVSQQGGTAPRWGSQDKELFYVEDTRLLSVKLTESGGKMTVGEPVRLFDGTAIGARLLGEYKEPAYAPTRDGQRFVIVQPQGASSLVMVQHWTQEFNR